MRRYIQTLAVAGIAAFASLGAAPAFAEQTSCQLSPIFQVLRDMVGRDRTGECNGQMNRNDGGDVTQPTTRGIMILRSVDQVVSFSDGQLTWLLGPNGLESRTSSSRLPWESTYAQSGSGATATPTPYGSSSYTYGATPTPTQSGVPGLAYNQSSGYNQNGANQTSYTQTPTSYEQTPTTTGQGQSSYNQYQTTNGQTQPQYTQGSTSNGQSQTGNGQAPATYGQAPNGRVGVNQVQPPFSPTPTPTPPLQQALPVSFDGNGGSSSKPFDLTGGTYIVAWQASQRNKDACYVGARLRHVEDQNPGSLVMHTTLGSEKDRSTSGETRLTNVAPGRYTLDVMTTGCSWKMTLREP